MQEDRENDVGLLFEFTGWSEFDFKKVNGEGNYLEKTCTSKIIRLDA